MGIVSFSHSPVLSLLLAPVHALAAWFVPAQAHGGRPFMAPHAAQRAPRQPTFPFVSPRAAARHGPLTPSPAALPVGQAPQKSRPSRLKVVREFDPGVSPVCAGRMVISGRIADVCAELERMSQRETPSH